MISRPLLHDGQGQAGVDALAVHQHGAGAALAAVAAFLGAGQLHGFAQGVEQAHPGFEQQVDRAAIDAQLKRDRRRKGQRGRRRRSVVFDRRGAAAHDVFLRFEFAVLEERSVRCEVPNGFGGV